MRRNSFVSGSPQQSINPIMNVVNLKLA
jgi:hypothetical protein